ncbi:hypothetical protein NPIL_7601 [Nephila pilipes]|uniref:Uncharacterized protein n=1 Tax=Nephila pilipes TaxID=299642 RepID=A0A8X6P8Z4_NEPPI|nr:hypothetical protein NPIL_7601 [Nephila pilipes]
MDSPTELNSNNSIENAANYVLPPSGSRNLHTPCSLHPHANVPRPCPSTTSIFNSRHWTLPAIDPALPPSVTLPPNRSALTSFLSFPASNDPATTLHPPWHPHLHLLPNNSRTERMRGMSDATSTGLCVRGFKWRKFRKGGNASLGNGEK